MTASGRAGLWRVLWWLALLVGSANLGVALGRVLHPVRYGNRGLWALSVLVCVAVLAWLWQLRLVGRGKSAAGDQALVSRVDTGREPAAWSNVARALSADEELDQWRDCLACLRQSLGQQELTASVLGVHIGKSVVEVIWQGVPPRPRWPWQEPVSGWLWQARLADVVACARAGEHQRPALPLMKLGRTRLGVLYLNLEAFEVVTVVENAEERGGLRRWWPAAQTVSDAGGCEVVWLDASLPALDAIRAIHRRARAIAQDLAGTGWVSALEARLGGGDPARFRPLAVFIGAGAPEDEVADVLEAARRSAAITCVLSETHPETDLALECRAGCVQVPFLPNVAVELPAVESCAEDDDASVTVVASESSAGVEVSSRDGMEDASLPGVVTELDVMTPAVLLVLVRLLGSIEVDGASDPLGGKGTELVAYLACHPEGVSVDRMKAALWPVREPRPQTWMNRVSACRQALGGGPDEELLFPHFDHQVGRLDRRVRTDVEILQAALERAATDRAWALVGLREALELVRGRPFEVPGGYEWAYEELHVAHAERVVTEGAHRLATVALEVGDWQLALWATTQGLLAAPASELLYQDRMRAFHAAGDAGGLEAAMRELLAAVGAKDADSALQPDTITLYEELRAITSARSPTARSS